MTGRTHVVVGVAVALGVLVGRVETPVLLLSVLPAALGGLLPDIDHPNASISRLLHVRLPVAHRGATHSALALLALGAGVLAVSAVAPLPGFLLAALWLGWASHVAIDAMTPHGVRLWWPVSFTRVRTPVLIPTGGLGERLLWGVVVVLLYLRLAPFY